MASSNDKTTTTTNQTGTPYAQGILSEAQRLYQNPNPTALVQADPKTYEGLDRTYALAQQGVVGLPQAQNFATGMIANNGMTGDLSQVAGYLTPFANGSMQEDPRLAAMLDTNANRAANAAATRFGGGRYGSAAIGQGVGTAVTDANNATMLQANENARTRQLQASGMLGSLYENGLGRAAQATSMLAGLNDLSFDPAQRIAGIGDYLTNRAQTEYDKDQTRLGQFGGLVQALGGMGGTATSAAPKASTAQRLIGGGLAGASLGNTLGIGSGVGALGGGLLGLFG